MVTLISLEITLELLDFEQNATADSMLQDSYLVTIERQIFCSELPELPSCHWCVWSLNMNMFNSKLLPICHLKKWEMQNI